MAFNKRKNAAVILKVSDALEKAGDKEGAALAEQLSGRILAWVKPADPAQGIIPGTEAPKDGPEHASTAPTGKPKGK